MSGDNIDMGREAILNSGNDFPPGVEPNRTTLPDGSIVDWHVGSSYGKDGVLTDRMVQMRFDVTADGNSDPGTMYRMDYHFKSAHPFPGASVIGVDYKAISAEGEWTSDHPPGDEWKTGHNPEPLISPHAVMKMGETLRQLPAFEVETEKHYHAAQELKTEEPGGHGPRLRGFGGPEAPVPGG